MRLEWSLFAQTDRDAIFDYIEADSPQAAITVDDRIRVQVEGLVQFPESGRPGRVEGTRELVIHRTPYSLWAIANKWMYAEIEVPWVTFGRILPSGQKLDVNVQNIAYRPHPAQDGRRRQRIAFRTNSLAFFLFSRVLSRGGGFNIGKM